MQLQERVTDGHYINTQFVAARVVYRRTKMKNSVNLSHIQDECKETCQ